MPTEPSYLVVGEALVDRVRWADGRVATHPGGSPMNVAYGLGRLGCRATLATQLGDDVPGRTIRAHLLRADVGVLAGGTPGWATAQATATIDESGAARYSFDIAWSFGGVPVGVHPDHVHTGSLAAYLGPGADAVERLVRGLRPTATISFDPNIRPDLVGDRDQVRGRTERLVALADVVKGSDEDLSWLYPDDDPSDVARRWVDLGAALVVVTRGAAGATAVTDVGSWEVAPVVVPVVDTVGAGDAFMSALLDGLGTAGLLGADARVRLRSSGLVDLDMVLSRAARAAAITVMRSGAEPPSRRDLDELPLLEQVETAARR